MRAAASPAGSPWLWTLAFRHHADCAPTRGYAASREAAMAGLAQDPRGGKRPAFLRNGAGIWKLEKLSGSAARGLTLSRVLRYRYQFLLWRVGIDEADGQFLGCAAAAETGHGLHELRGCCGRRIS